MPPQRRSPEPPAGNTRSQETPPDTNAKRDGFQATPADPDPSVPTPRHSPLYGKLVQFYGTIALGVAGFGDAHCASAVAASAEATAEAWDELAKQNPAVKRVLEAVLQTGAWGAVIAAHFPIGLAVAIHHRPELAERFMPFAGMATTESPIGETGQQYAA